MKRASREGGSEESKLAKDATNPHDTIMKAPCSRKLVMALIIQSAGSPAIYSFFRG